MDILCELSFFECLMQGFGCHISDFLALLHKLGVGHFSIGLKRTLEFDLAVEFQVLVNIAVSTVECIICNCRFKASPLNLRHLE